MKAYVLAAGNGSRLGDLTKDTPKCLLKVGGKPMLRWWLDAIFGCRAFDNVVVNVHHLADAVEAWLAAYEKETGRHVQVIDERTKLLGTAGTLYWHGDSTDDFFLAYADTFSERIFNELPIFAQEWKMTGGLASLFSFDSPHDGSSGSMDIDPKGWIVQFVEKFEMGTRAWAGCFFASSEIFDYIRAIDLDLARDVFPRLCGKIKIMAHVDAYDIGRSESCYERAKEKFSILQTGKR